MVFVSSRKMHVSLMSGFCQCCRFLFFFQSLEHSLRLHLRSITLAHLCLQAAALTQNVLLRGLFTQDNLLTISNGSSTWCSIASERPSFIMPVARQT